MPVTQFNMKWVEPAGLVKFDFLGLKTLTVLDVAVKLLKQRGIDDRSRRRCRSTTPRATRCWRAAKWSACSRWKARACGARCSTCAPTASRTSSRWWRSIARARWRTSRPTARASMATKSRTICIRCWSRSCKETFGVIIYQEQVMQIAQVHGRLFARRRRPAAPRDGQEDPRRDGQAARGLRRRRRQERRAERAGRYDLRTARKVRRLRLQQEPRRGLRAGRPIRPPT